MIFLQLPDKEKIELINQMHNETNLPQVIIEKDLWVTAVLRALFELPYADNISFKGGTSLSKCWNLIERFSEDVDIAINREYFGFTGDSFTIRQISKELRKKTCKFIRETLQFDLHKSMLNNGIPHNLFSVSMDITPITTVDPERVFVEYQSVFVTDKYIKNTVILEVSGRSMKEPIEKIRIESFIDKYFSNAAFSQQPFEIIVVVPERTFWEKVCLLHEEFSKSTDNIRVERMSRHLYDLARMMNSSVRINALTNQDLFNSIVSHRSMFIPISGFNYDTLTSKSINIIPPENLIDSWEKDYNKMQTMIYGENILSFKEIIGQLVLLNEEINKLNWE
ncbi:MAG: nucleotidyl transferase AbiEii/AbiGii toxin family protein [Bacteroidales bacterium]